MESKKVILLDKIAFTILLVSVFVSMFFFIPYVPVTLEAGKGFLISIGVSLSLIFWLIARLGDGKFVFPKDRLIIFGLVIPIVFLLSSFFSSSFYISFFGNGFELGTFGSMLILFIIFFLSSIYFQSEKRLWYFIGSLFLSGFILILFELLNSFIGFERILPGSLRGLLDGNLVGSWNNFALLFGLFALISLFTIELLNTKGWLRVLQYLLLFFSLVFVVIINNPFVWLLIGMFSIVIFVYNTSIRRAGIKFIKNDSETEENKNFPLISLIVVFLSIIFLISSNLVGNIISRYIIINNIDIRPSIVTTSQIAYQSIKHNFLLGTGPNTFVIDWALWHPKQIAQTIFWNTDFNNGFSLFTTFLTTVGILGFVSVLIFLVLYLIRGFQSIKIALQNRISNYFVLTVLMISLYSWASVIFYNPNIIMLILTFVSSGILIGILAYKKAIPVMEFSFLKDPRTSFFSILGLIIVMVLTILLVYVYIQKLTSVIYFSKGLNNNIENIESLSKSERMIVNAIALDRNDAYLRTLSQVYIKEISLMMNDTNISKDILKSNLQQLINNAQASAESAVSQNPKQYLNYLNLGNVYSSFVPLSVANSYESAVGAYDKAMELAPNNPLILLTRAQLEFIMDKNEEAKKYIDEALSLKPDYTDARFLLVQIETNSGNLIDAIKQAEYAGQLNPYDETIFFRLGLLRYNNSDYSGAISAFEKAVVLNNNYLNARYFLAQAYEKVGRKEEALTQYKLLEKIAPDSQEVKKAIDSLSGSGLVSGEMDNTVSPVEVTNNVN